MKSSEYFRTFNDTYADCYAPFFNGRRVKTILEKMNRAWVHAAASLLQSKTSWDALPFRGLKDLSWRHHGLGMLQAELTEELRVHVWDPALVTITEPFRNVHDHRFDLFSFVMCGSVTDQAYEVVTPKQLADSSRGELPWGPWDSCVMWEVLHAKLQTPGFEHGATNLGARMAHRRDPVIQFKGQTYFIPKRRFHTTIPTRRAITLVYRTNFDAGNARVLGASDSTKLESGIVHHDAIMEDDKVLAALDWANEEIVTFFQEFLAKEDPR